MVFYPIGSPVGDWNCGDWEFFLEFGVVFGVQYCDRSALRTVSVQNSVCDWIFGDWRWVMAQTLIKCRIRKLFWNLFLFLLFLKPFRIQRNLGTCISKNRQIQSPFMTGQNLTKGSLRGLDPVAIRVPKTCSLHKIGLAIDDWRLAIVDWRLAVVDWRLSIVDWRLAIVDWRLSIVDWRLRFFGDWVLISFLWIFLDFF